MIAACGETTTETDPKPPPKNFGTFRPFGRLPVWWDVVQTALFFSFSSFKSNANPNPSNRNPMRRNENDTPTRPTVACAGKRRNEKLWKLAENSTSHKLSELPAVAFWWWKQKLPKSIIVIFLWRLLDHNPVSELERWPKWNQALWSCNRCYDWAPNRFGHEIGICTIFVWFN